MSGNMSEQGDILHAKHEQSLWLRAHNLAHADVVSPVSEALPDVC